jgi:GTPase involved in cell partitioning and DNA repair
MKIDNHYITEANRIITSYNKVVAELAVFEKTLADNKTMLLKMKDDVEDLKNSNGTDLLKKQKLAEIMHSYDKEIGRLQDVMMPYVSQLEKLRKDSSVLYGVLKEKYPGASDDQLQEQIFRQIEEQKKRA